MKRLFKNVNISTKHLITGALIACFLIPFFIYIVNMISIAQQQVKMEEKIIEVEQRISVAIEENKKNEAIILENSKKHEELQVQYNQLVEEYKQLEIQNKKLKDENDTLFAKVKELNDILK